LFKTTVSILNVTEKSWVA